DRQCPRDPAPRDRAAPDLHSGQGGVMSHVSQETLVALWAGEVNDASLEEHLFSCDACAEQAQDLARLMEALGEVLPPVISAAHRHRLEASGARIKVTDVEAGVDAHARFAPEVDLLIHRLRADLRDVERVDVEIRVGEETKVTLANAPFEQGGVLIACQRHYEHVFG